MNNALTAAAQNPLARSWSPIASDNGTVEAGVLTFVTTGGLTYRMAPELDARSKWRATVGFRFLDASKFDVDLSSGRPLR